MGRVIVLATALVGAQTAPVQFPVRDTAPPARNERRIAVGTASISGTVIASDTGAPIPDANVTLTGDVITIQRTVLTDSTGQFSFPRLPAGVFQVNVDPSDNQYLETNFGQRRLGGEGKSIVLSDGQRVAIHVPLIRGSVIAGRVVGPNGRPVSRLHVAAFRTDMSTGRRQMEQVGSAETDDRGLYRIFGLPPGTYLVAAVPDASTWTPRFRHEGAADVERAIATAGVIHAAADGRPAMITVSSAPTANTYYSILPNYLPTYAPGSLTPAAATLITLAPNEERLGVDIHAHAVESSVIRGIVTTPLDAGMGVQLWLANADSFVMSAASRMVRADRDGEFVFRNVEPGHYSLLALTYSTLSNVAVVNGSAAGGTASITERQKMWAQTQVTVTGAPVGTVSIALMPTRSISGTVVFDQRQPPDLAQINVVVYARRIESGQQIYLPDGVPSATVGPDGRFTIAGLPGGRYMLGLDGLLKSAVVDGHDTLDSPLDFGGERDVTGAVLTVSDRLSLLTGALTDANGRPVLDHVVIAAATDSRYWHANTRRVQRAFLEANGRFTFTGLPAGQYQISVVPDLEPGDLFNPDFLRAVARTSVTVTVPDAGTVTQHLRVK